MCVGGDKMKISKEKIELILAKKNLKVVEAAKIMGMTRQNFWTIVNNLDTKRRKEKRLK